MNNGINLDIVIDANKREYKDKTWEEIVEMANNFNKEQELILKQRLEDV